MYLIISSFFTERSKDTKTVYLLAKSATNKYHKIAVNPNICRVWINHVGLFGLVTEGFNTFPFLFVTVRTL